jgi:hypothetical protein
MMGSLTKDKDDTSGPKEKRVNWGQFPDIKPHRKGDRSN